MLDPNIRDDSLYQLLGVTRESSDKEIRQGYIRESLRYHPDRNPEPDATRKFQLVASAYYVLSDPVRRQKYHDSVVMEGLSPNPFAVFAQVFDDLLVPEVPNPVFWYQPLGAAGGAMLGFIVFNIPGALIGGYYGSRMGKVRDMKGKSVYEAFRCLSSDKRTEILAALAKQFITTAITG